MLKLSAQIGDAEREVAVEPLEEGRWRVVIAGAPQLVDARRLADGGGSLLVDGRPFTVDVDPGKDGELAVEVCGKTVAVKLLDARRRLLAEAPAPARRARTRGGPVTGHA